MELSFKETAMFTQPHAKAMAKKGKQSKSWAKSAHRGKSKDGKRDEHPKEHPTVPKAPKVRTRVKHRKLFFIWFFFPKKSEIREDQSEAEVSAQTYRTDHSYMDNSWSDDGWSFDEWKDEWSSVGWHEGWEQTYHSSGNPLSLGSFDLDAMSRPKRFEWVKMNLDTGAAVNTCPLSPVGAGDGRCYRTANGECIPDGAAWQSQDYDEHGLCRSLNGRLTGVHEVFCSAGEIACEGRQDFFLRSDGGFMISALNKIGKEIRRHFEKIGELARKKRAQSSSHRRKHLQFLREHCSAAGKRVWQSSALVSPTKTLNRNLNQLVMALNQLKRHVKMSKLGTMKMKNP